MPSSTHGSGTADGSAITRAAFRRRDGCAPVVLGLRLATAVEESHRDLRAVVYRRAVRARHWRTPAQLESAVLLECGAGCTIPLVRRTVQSPAVRKRCRSVLQRHLGFQSAVVG